MRNYFLCSIICLCWFRGLSQDISFRAPELPRVAIRANIGIPKIVNSEMYRNSFSGILSGEAGITYKLFSNYIVGIGYNYNYFKAQRYFRENANINASMQLQGGFLKIGYDHFFSPTAFTTISLNMGYQNGRYRGLMFAHDSLEGKYPTQFNNAYVEPMIGVYFIVDPDFAFGAHLSYSYNFEQYNPLYTGFNKFGFAKSVDKPKAYNDLSNKWGMGMITLGFGFYYGIRKG